MLGDAAGFARRDLGATDVIEQRGLAVVDMAHDRDHRRTRTLLALLVFDVRHQFGFGVVAAGADSLVAQFLGDQHSGIVIDRLRDGRHDAHLEQGLDHIAALERQLLRQIGDGDRIADGDLANDLLGRTGETVLPAAAAALLELTLGLGFGTRGRAAVALGRGQVQLARKTGRAVVVLDVGDHRVRTAIRFVLLGAIVDAGRFGTRGFDVSVGSGLGTGSGRRSSGGFFPGCDLGRRRSGSAGRRFIGEPLALGSGFGALAIIFGQPLLFFEIARARFLELAHDVGALVVAAGRGASFLRLDQRDFLAHHDIDRLPVLAAADGDFLLAVAVERDLLRPDRFFGSCLALAMGALQETEQLQLLGAGHGLIGAAEGHAGLGQLFQQLLDRRVHQFGQCADGGLLRHSVSVS